MTQNTINRICKIVDIAHRTAVKSLGANCKLGKVPAELEFHIWVGKDGTWNLTDKGVRTVRIADFN